MPSALPRIIEQFAHVLLDTDLILTLTFVANNTSALLIQNVPPHWPAKMRNVLIHASVQDLLTALQEIIEASVLVSLATLEIHMALLVPQVGFSL